VATSTTDPDKLIVERYLAGETSSFNELVGRHERPIYNLAYRMVGNTADAADLTQEIFIHLHKKLAGFRGESAFSTWLYRLSINYGKDWLQKQARQIKTIQIDEALLTNGGTGPGSMYEQKEVQQVVQAAILDLDDDQRIAVILHDLQGYDYKSIAEVTGVPICTVKSRLSRARQKLAEKLTPYGNDFEK
jgi:RNA polymerase sigma-70 factor (ECF subfamily)